jgi:hypothetical protein
MKVMEPASMRENSLLIRIIQPSNLGEATRSCNEIGITRMRDQWGRRYVTSQKIIFFVKKVQTTWEDV